MLTLGIQSRDSPKTFDHKSLWLNPWIFPQEMHEGEEI